MPKVIRTKHASVELKEIDLFVIFADATGMGDLHDFKVQVVTEDGLMEIAELRGVILTGTFNEDADGDTKRRHQAP